jgi:osmotically-inducible protein OsmY
VDSYFEKGRADDVASRAKGVTEVNNRLEVEYGQPLTYEPYLDDTYIYGEDWYDYQPAYTFTDDAEIKEEIDDEMWWSPFVDSDEVTVRVDDGVARLSGTVESWSEREAARENAYEGGATWVINKIEIED